VQPRSGFPWVSAESSPTVFILKLGLGSADGAGEEEKEEPAKREGESVGGGSLVSWLLVFLPELLLP
jgi:uncharacterized spore protein YtfJ